MARSGVIYEEVKQAAEALLAAKINPTHARVRAHLGGGSFSTIGRHLNAWRQARDHVPPQGTPPPEGLQDVVLQVWQSLDTAAEERVAEAKAQAEAEIESITAAADERVAAVEAEAQSRIEAIEAKRAAVEERTRGEVMEAIAGWKEATGRSELLAEEIRAGNEARQRLAVSLAETQEKLSKALQEAVAERESHAQVLAETRAELAATHESVRSAAEAHREERRAALALQASLQGELSQLQKTAQEAAQAHGKAMSAATAAHEHSARQVAKLEERVAGLMERCEALQLDRDKAWAMVRQGEDERVKLEARRATLEVELVALQKASTAQEASVRDSLAALETAVANALKARSSK